MQRSNSSARRAVNLVALLAVAIAALSASAAKAHDPSLELRARGTAVVDGIESPGEWDRAARWNFTAAAPGGSTAATLYAMNDGVSLYWRSGMLGRSSTARSISPSTTTTTAPVTKKATTSSS